MSKLRRKYQNITAWSYDVEGHAQKCVERFCELAHKTVDQLQKDSKPCLEDHQVKPEDLEIVRELSNDSLSDCIEMFENGKNRKTRFPWDSKLLGKTRHTLNRACDFRRACLLH